VSLVASTRLRCDEFLHALAALEFELREYLEAVDFCRGRLKLVEVGKAPVQELVDLDQAMDPIFEKLTVKK
jgi:hypothetical protein